jgi:hypothetical protein
MKIVVYIETDEGKEIIRKVVTGSGKAEFGEISVSDSEKTALKKLSTNKLKGKE